MASIVLNASGEGSYGLKGLALVAERVIAGDVDVIPLVSVLKKALTKNFPVRSRVGSGTL